jgi:hypothetical protein
MLRTVKNILTYCLNAYFIWANYILSLDNSSSAINHFDYSEGKLPQESRL